MFKVTAMALVMLPETRSLTCKNNGAQGRGCKIEWSQQSAVKLLGVTGLSSYLAILRFVDANELAMWHRVNLYNSYGMFMRWSPKLPNS